MIDLLDPEDWRVLRLTRLRALCEAPQAFLSTSAREGGWTEAEWRKTFDSGVWAVARRYGRVIGLARSSWESHHPAVRHIESVWVEPRARRRGIASSLVQWLIERELATGVADIRLWIVAGNDVARSFYEQLGFRSTGECQPIPGDGSRLEERLRFPPPDR